MHELELLQKAIRSGKRVKLAPGVIGKSAVMWCIVILLWALAVAKLAPGDPWWFTTLLLAGPTFVTLGVARETGKMREYAKENPGPAMLEGAELTEYKRMEAAAAKGALAPDNSKPVAGALGAEIVTDKAGGPQP